MKNNELFKTNLLISIILIIGFSLTAVFSYNANYQSSLENIEQVSSLSTDGIYYQLNTKFTKPVNISLAMSHDSLLVKHIKDEEKHMNDKAYVDITRNYLENYRKKYGFDAVFLVSAATGRYYNFNGIDRVLEKGDAENVWYYDFLDSDETCRLNVDNDEVDGADNAITVFVNCKVEDMENNVLGVVGVGIRIEYLKEMLKSYEDNFNIAASLIDDNGTIEVSTEHTGYEKTDWFEAYSQQGIREQVLGWKEENSNLEVWSTSDSKEKNYVVTRYIPELSWHLVVGQNTGEIIGKMKQQLYQTCFLIALVILAVLFIITTVIRHFNKQITELMEERQAMFKKATEQLYDNIYELNITKNCTVGKRTKEYFESFGAKGLSYDQGLRVIAEKQIKKEFREGYVSTFTPENVKKEYEKGNNHLKYDFMITQDGTNYYWMRIDAYIFYSSEDNSIHMFVYRKNIDYDKQKEIQALTDEMTGFYTKKATERIIGRMLKNTDKKFAFFIFNIDNFKQAIDLYGHIFGDYCIKEFTGTIRKHFRSNDILGRVGGDEFVAFIPVPNTEWVELKAEELSKTLNMECSSKSNSWKMSASIGVAVTPEGGLDFDTLYANADSAMYMTKKRGKNGFTIYRK